MNGSSAIFDVARDTIDLLNSHDFRADGDGSTQDDPVSTSGRALAYLNDLLTLQLDELGQSAHGLRLIGRAILETWVTGHGVLLLDSDGRSALHCRSTQLAAQSSVLSATATEGVPTPRVPTLMDIARLLDLKMYGSAEPPRAFQRHVASFYDEVDIGHVEGTMALFVNRAAIRKPSETQADHLRVSLWVVLFLAHDYFAAANRPETAAAARALFDRLRIATDDFYAQRRTASRSSSE